MTLATSLFWIFLATPTLAAIGEMKPFYDFKKTSFVSDAIKVIWMDEVPGMRQHFWVLGWYGEIYTLYPDNYDPKSVKPNPNMDYPKKRIADFKSKVHPAINGEYGAWNLSFHPDFQTNGKFYVIYMAMKPGQDLKPKTGGFITVDEWVATGEMKDQVNFTRTILSYEHLPSHGVSCMTFGPDGYLYIAVGDYAKDSQDFTTLARKVLRIDVDKKEGGKEYGIPSDNPLVGRTEPNIRKEIWAWGIRNIWGLHFDDLTGDLFAGEVGQNTWEELNIITKGSNGGWADKGDGTGSIFGAGFSGPCYPGKMVTSLKASRDCSQFMNPFWAFPRNPTTVAGEIGEEGNYIRFSSILGGRTFLGAKNSPLYGNHIFSDTRYGIMYATKANQPATYSWTQKSDGSGVVTISGTPPKLIGRSSNAISDNTDGHDGIVYIGRDSFGYLYAVYASWRVGRDYREIYRFDHPDMKPAITGCTDDKFSGYNKLAGIHDQTQCGTPVSIGQLPAVKKMMSRLVISNGRDNSVVDVPKGVRGFVVFDVKGKNVWSHSQNDIGQDYSIQLPSNIGEGVFRIKPMLE